MIVLGIDPGFDRCGWAKIRRQVSGVGIQERGMSASSGNGCELIGCGLFKTVRGEAREARLKDLFVQVEKVLRTEPLADLMALEEAHLPPKGIRISNLMGLGEARGVLMLAASRAGINVVPVHALQVKTTITGRSQSSKQDVARFVRHLIGGVGESLIDDTTDAVAIALSVALTSVPSSIGATRNSQLGATPLAHQVPRALRTAATRNS